MIEITEVSSPFCGIGTDDLTIKVDGLSLKVIENGCTVNTPAFEQPITDTSARVDGKEVSLEIAITKAAPIGLYLYGYMEKNTDLQVAGLALGQSALLGWLTSAAFKVFTGRVAPIKLSDPDDVNGDFRFGFLKGGINDGWPSGHTSTALAMATTLCELYPDNTVLHIGAFTYASLIGLGVSSRIHWASDVFSGALIGYAVGKTVGMSFKKLMKKKEKAQAFNFSVAPSGAAFNYSF